MFSEIARRDLEHLRAAGYAPTDADVVRLNDLAVRIERGKDTTPANMPRIAFAGNQILHEPTLGAIEWWEQYGRDAAWSDRGRLLTYIFMLVYAQDVEGLSRLQKGSDIRKAVKAWTKSCSATENELWRALMWVRCGTEPPPEPAKEPEDPDAGKDALWMTLIAAAGATGLSPDDLKTRTTSELDAMLVQANLRAGIPMKASVARDYMAYRQVLREIEGRGRKND